ncbi:zinc metalloprotease [mine drainage metagenome]|uniref:Zinc metalloprotease n=1 Tax=mine drainage metagenome TaxID=410659 RepID=T1C5S4_9ZZZZ
MDREKERILTAARDIFGKAEIRNEGDMLFLTLDGGLQNEIFFDKFYDSIKGTGYICFIANENEIGLVRRDKKVKNNIKLLLLILTLLSVIYAGYTYSYSYYSGTTMSQSLFDSIIFFAIPIFSIFMVREIPKVVIHRRSGIPYSIPIFVPNPISMGTMGLINAPEIPYKNRNDMIVSSSLSLIFGFCLAMIFYVIGLEGISYSSPAITAVNIPAQTISPPLIFQAIFLKYLPIQGNLDPLAYAGWVGMIFTSFNAFPIGFLDGGVILALNRHELKKTISYIALFAMIIFSLTFSSWLILPIFVLLMGINAPMPLNHLQSIRAHSKILAVAVLIILFIGIAPYPFHISQSSFSMNSQNSYGIVVNNTTGNEFGGSTSFTFEVKNTGPNMINPAFAISPVTPFNVTGYKTALTPGSEEYFSIYIASVSVKSMGVNNFNVAVSSGQYTKSLNIHIYKIALSKSMNFNNSNPFTFNMKGKGSASLSFTTKYNQTVSIFMVSPNNMSYSGVISGTSVKEKGTSLLTVNGTIINAGTSETIIITPKNLYLPFELMVVNQTWVGAIAIVET